MRRSLTRATAVLATYALALSLGGAATATADYKASASTDGAAGSGALSGEPGRTPSADGGEHEQAGSLSTSVTDTSFASVRSGRGRTEAESSLWTYVDRAFPDRTHDGAGTASVGIGRLAWDRVYTRRALFRFPVALDPDTVVDSAVLRAEAVWSYDCDSNSSVQLHQVDPFRNEVTWNEQPAARALLDTRKVRGGRAACPVSGGVEFDVTGAVQRAVDNGEPHLHLRLAERDESGTTAWRRFDVEDDPPVLVVDHSAPRTPGTDSGPPDVPTDVPDGPRDGTAVTGPSGDRDAVHDEDAQDPSPPRSVEGVALSGGTVPVIGGTDGVTPKARGPPTTTPLGDRLVPGTPAEGTG